MMTQTYIGLLEAAKLELAGAEQRLRIATQTLEEFLADRLGASLSPDLRQSLDHERASLECELDAARRQVRHCLDVVTSLSKE